VVLPRFSSTLSRSVFWVYRISTPGHTFFEILD
jgi:hypothetical protein